MVYFGIYSNPALCAQARLALCVQAHLLAPSLSPVEPVARHGRATPPPRPPTGRRPLVRWDPLSPALSQPSPAMWCRHIDCPPPPRVSIK
jgi:hypothetical protein